jgi:hypothetical protein
LRKAALFLALALGLTAAAAAQSGGMQPASANDVAAAVSNCWTAVSGSGLESSKLEALGWKPASTVDAQGKTVALPMTVYGKTGANSIIVANPGPASQSLCTVVASIGSLTQINAAISTIKQSLIALDPNVKAARSDGGIVFIALPRLAMLNATGSKAKPGVRVVVAYQNPEKK